MSNEPAGSFRRNQPSLAVNDRQGESEDLYSHTGSLPALPNRYRIKDTAKGRTLVCVEAPTVTVRAERGLVVTAAQARNYAPGTIFLDGAAQGGPFVDAQKELCNLDHHEGCVRSFTLATCEQAMVLIRKLLDLRKREWLVLANDPDLDTVLAIWVLLNHVRLNDDAEARARVMPLLRLEGNIDAHGFDLQELAALPGDIFRSTATTLKQLQHKEAMLKRKRIWSKIDHLEYIADQLHLIDGLIYSLGSFEGIHDVEELARAEIANGSIAVVCRSDAGIYDLERQLRKIHGERLGILVLQNTPSAYTLRQVDQMLPATLERAYELLNLIDPAASGNSQNRWGGSTEIGGSPRETGTRLTAAQIINILRRAFRKQTLVDSFSEIARAVFITMAIMLPALAPIFSGLQSSYHKYIGAEAALPSAVILVITAGVLFGLKARRAPGLYGYRAPIGFGWLVMLPIASIGAMGGGLWMPGSFGHHERFYLLLNELTLYALLFSLAGEILFRGLILGNLAARLPIQKTGGPWFLSWPTLISGVLYAVASVFLFLTFSTGEIQVSTLLTIFTAALIFGIASGLARERSGSILSSILLHWGCAAALVTIPQIPFPAVPVF